MIKKTFTLLLMFIAFVINAQNVDVNNIKKSKLHFWGESPVCDTYEKAKNKAMEMMCANILETMESSPVEMGMVDKETHLEKIMHTLENKISYKRKIVNVVRDTKNDKYSCFAYLTKDDFKSICDERKSDVQRYAEIGNDKEEEHVMVDALRSYYWAMMLCVAHPDGKMLKIEVDGEEVNAYTYLYDRLTEVLDSFTFAIAKDNPGEIDEESISIILNVRADDNDVDGLRFKYYNGVDDYVRTMANNGKAEVVLNANNVKEFDIKIEYDFSHEMIAHPEIMNVLENIDKVVMKDNVKRDINIAPYIKYLNGDKKPTTVVNNTELDSNDKYFLKVMQDLEAAFRAKNYYSIKKYFTNESYAMLDTLVRNGNISIVGNQQYEFITYGNTTICRDIDMKFEFRNHASFIREVVFRFDNKSQLITSLAFRLSSIAEHDISSKNKWTNDCKLALINFLEDYQTAYALKRYDYLESIFSDDALFIVGHVLKRNNNELKDVKQFNLSEQEVELLRMDKNAYFDRLSRVFKSQEYINIRFTETDFKRQMFSTDENNTNGEDIFGVRLLQEYHSTTYGDVGYLFLMVDLRDVQRPVIHVRAWQPDKVDISTLVNLRDLE